MVSTMVREPREHVLSQYMECAYGMQHSVWRKDLAWESDGGVSDEEFERWFTGFVAKNFAIGGGFGAVLYFTVKALRDAL